jgi:UDP-glucose 4-epimerase
VTTPTNQPKRALVTGGAGFIGSHLVDRLLADGHEVAVIDSLVTGRIENLEHVQDNAALTIHIGDINDPAKLDAAMNGVDWVFHLAALADIVPSIQKPQDYHRSNVDGTVAVLEAARHAQVQRFVYAASASCYGLPDVFPTPETAPPHPMYPYALTKYLGEQYVMHWAQVYGLPAVSTRFFNVFGPRSRTTGAYGAVFGVFLAQKLAGKPLTVVGTGEQTRDFTFVTDIADAVVAVAESSVVGDVFNVGSGGTYSVNEIVALLDSEVEHLPKRPGEPDCTFADISKITRELGWQPKVAFADGVRVMLENIERWWNAPVWDRDAIGQATEDWFKYLGR